MKATVQHNGYGQIEYEENFWTGKKELSINGTKLTKQKKNEFALNNQDGTLTCRITGNFLRGARLLINQDEIELTTPTKWYEFACAISIFLLILVWGNTPALCAIIPVIGGAIGGAISGVAAFVNLFLMKKTKNVSVKLLIWLGMLVATFLVCFVIALGILMVMY